MSALCRMAFLTRELHSDRAVLGKLRPHNDRCETGLSARMLKLQCHVGVEYNSRLWKLSRYRELFKNGSVSPSVSYYGRERIAVREGRYPLYQAKLTQDISPGPRLNWILIIHYVIATIACAFNPSMIHLNLWNCDITCYLRYLAIVS